MLRVLCAFVLTPQAQTKQVNVIKCLVNVDLINARAAWVIKPTCNRKVMLSLHCKNIYCNIKMPFVDIEAFEAFDDSQKKLVTMSVLTHS